MKPNPFGAALAILFSLSICWSLQAAAPVVSHVRAAVTPRNNHANLTSNPVVA